MRAITPNQVRELATFAAGLCVSFYMPTRPVGQEIAAPANHLLLKNQMKEAAVKMAERGFSEQAAHDFLLPLQQLIDDRRFWRTPSRGLAVFLASDHLQYFHLPFHVTPLTYVGYEFYITPLLPALSGHGSYFLLSLNLQGVALFRADFDQFQQVNTEPPIPQHMEEVIGSDYRPRFQAVYGGKVGGHSHHGYYGQGEWQEDEKQEILRFFRAIHETISPTIRGTEIPLVLAGLDHLLALYREVEDYPHLHEAALRLNPKDKNAVELHQLSREMLAPYFDQDKLSLTEKVRQLQHTERVATNIQDVVPAALGGRIEALFLDSTTEIWGVYHQKKAQTEVHTKQQIGNTALTNLVAGQVFLQGGQVFLVERTAMPLDFAPVNALFRY